MIAMEKVEWVMSRCKYLESNSEWICWNTSSKDLMEWKVNIRTYDKILGEQQWMFSLVP